MNKFWIRTASSVVYVSLFLGTMFSGVLLKNALVGTVIFLAFMVFVAFGCTFEFYRISKMKGARPIEWMGYILVFLFVAAFACFDKISWHGSRSATEFVLLAALICVFLAMPVAAIVQLWRKTGAPFGDVGYTFIPLLYIAFPLGLMVLLQVINPYLLLVVVVLVWINDACAYMLGSLLGRHKMWLKHSPAKTWEGTISGIVIATVVGAFVAMIWTSAYQDMYAWEVWPCAKMRMWQGALLGFICGVVGTLGDLVESMLKRAVGIKDSGKILPGHGGFLDRFDSLLLLMPFVMLVIVFCFV